MSSSQIQNNQSDKLFDGSGFGFGADLDSMTRLGSLRLYGGGGGGSNGRW
jgi:hypothetical protein